MLPDPSICSMHYWASRVQADERLSREPDPEEEPDDDSGDGNIEPDGVGPAGDSPVTVEPTKGREGQGIQDQGKRDGGKDDVGNQNGKINHSNRTGAVEWGIPMQGVVGEIAGQKGCGGEGCGNHGDHVSLLLRVANEPYPKYDSSCAGCVAGGIKMGQPGEAICPAIL